MQPLLAFIKNKIKGHFKEFSVVLSLTFISELCAFLDFMLKQVDLDVIDN